MAYDKWSNIPVKRNTFVFIIISLLVLLIGTYIMIVNSEKEFVISFQYNEHLIIHEEIVNKGEYVYEPSIPPYIHDSLLYNNNEGYYFYGWVHDSLDEELFDFSEPIYNNYTLNAKFVRLNTLLEMELQSKSINYDRLEEAEVRCFESITNGITINYSIDKIINNNDEFVLYYNDINDIYTLLAESNVLNQYYDVIPDISITLTSKNMIYEWNVRKFSGYEYLDLLESGETNIEVSFIVDIESMLLDLPIENKVVNHLNEIENDLQSYLLNSSIAKINLIKEYGYELEINIVDSNFVVMNDECKIPEIYEYLDDVLLQYEIK